MRIQRWLWPSFALLGLLLAPTWGGGLLGPRTSKAATNCGTSSPSATRAASGTVTLAGFPLLFEENSGQADASVRLLARTPAFTLVVTRDGDLVLLPRDSDGRRDRQDEGTRGAAPGAATPLRVEFVGRRRPLRVAGERPLDATVSYFKGSSPDRWHTGIRTFERVRCSSVYPGIDVVVRGSSRGLEFDFELEPGADARGIGLRLATLDGTYVRPHPTPGGGLSARVGGATLALGRLDIYQDSAGIRRPVAGQWQLRGDDTVGVTVDAYGREARLVIDPTLQYSTLLGGSSTDYPSGIAIDGEGSVYLVGSTVSANFPVPAGSPAGSLSGSTDVFVAKLTPDGRHLSYVTFVGGAGADNGYGIAVDGDGAAAITGVTSSIDFPTTTGAFRTVSAGRQDGFIARLTPQGDGLVYSTYLGSSDDDWLISIALDAAGSAYVAGHTHAINYPSTPQAYRPQPTGRDATVTKLSPDGRTLMYSTFLGLGNPAALVEAVAVDQQGSAYVTGWFQAGQTASYAFVIKLAPDGRNLAYSKSFAESTSGASLAVDEAGSAYVMFLTEGQGSSADLAVAKFDPAGSGPVFWTDLGGNGEEWNISSFGHTKEHLGLALGTRGEIWVVGSTTSTDFPTTEDAWSRSMAGGGRDGFIFTLSASGGVLQYSTYLGGGGGDWPDGVAIDPAGDPWVVGKTSSSDFPTTPAAPKFGTLGGSSDVFLVRIGEAACSATVPAQGRVGQAVSFQGPSSLTDESPVLAYDWDFGDGSPHSSQQSPEHAYAHAGVYTWVLVGTSATGTCSATGTVEVTSAPVRVRRRLYATRP